MQIDPRQIPDEVVEAFWRELILTGSYRAALAAGLTAWPGVIKDGDIVPGENCPPLRFINAIILPLAPETDNG